MSSQVFPRRNLPESSEDWGRKVEDQIRELSKENTLIKSTLSNLNRTMSGVGSALSATRRQTAFATKSAQVAAEGVQTVWKEVHNPTRKEEQGIPLDSLAGWRAFYADWTLADVALENGILSLEAPEDEGLYILSPPLDVTGGDWRVAVDVRAVEESTSGTVELGTFPVEENGEFTSLVSHEFVPAAPWTPPEDEDIDPEPYESPTEWVSLAGTVTVEGPQQLSLALYIPPGVTYEARTEVPGESEGEDPTVVVSTRPAPLEWRRFGLYEVTALEEARKVLAKMAQDAAERAEQALNILAQLEPRLDDAEQDLFDAIVDFDQTRSALEAAINTIDQKADTATQNAQLAHNTAVEAWEKALASASSGGSLILNGGFEQGLAEWGGDGELSTPGHTGDNALKLTPESSAHQTQTIPTSEGRVYLIGGWVKRLSGASTAGGSFTAEVSSPTSTETVNTGNVLENVSSEWTKVSGKVTVALEEATELTFGLTLGAGDSVVAWDSLFAVDITEAEAALAAAEEARSRATAAEQAVAVAVVGSEVEYAKNLSPTNPPTTGWAESQTHTEGSYIWQRTKVTYGDGTSVYTSPVLMTGNTGPSGDSLYTWFKYADTPTTGMSNSPVGKSYIGIAYNQPTDTPSSDYGDYEWTLFKGDPGDSGDTLYTWVKYAVSDTGAGMSDGPEGKDYIGLAFNKTSPVASDFASDYTWTLIKGAPGDPGDPGEDGVSVESITPFFHRTPKTSPAPANPGGVATPPEPWTETEPSYVVDTALWRTDRVVYSDGSVSYTTVTRVTAYDVAAQAMLSASGKNSIIRSTLDASGSVHPQTGQPNVEGDEWWKLNVLNAAGRTVGRWQWDGDSWVPVKISHEVIDSVDVNQLKVHGTGVIDTAVIEKLWAEMAHIVKLSANQILVHPGNEFPDPYFEDTAGWTGLGVALIQDASVPGNVLQITGTTTVRGSYYHDLTDAGKTMALRPGDKYRVTLRRKSSVLARDIEMRLISSGGTTQTTIPRNSVSNTWEEVSFEITAPTGVGKALPSFHTRTTLGSGDIQIADVRVTSLVDGTLITPGSITSPHLNITDTAWMSDAVIGDLITRSAFIDTLVSERIITKDMIADGAVIARHLAIAAEDALTGTTLTLTPDGLRIMASEGGDPLVALTASGLLGLHLRGAGGTVTTSVTAESVTAPEVSAATSLKVAGRDVLTELDGRLRLVDHGRANVSHLADVDWGETRLLHIGFQAKAGRRYLLRFSPITFTPKSGVTMTTPWSTVVRLRRTTNGSEPIVSPTLSPEVWSGEIGNFGPLSAAIAPEIPLDGFAVDTTVRLILTATAWNYGQNITRGPVYFFLYEVGADTPGTGGPISAGRAANNTNPGTTPAPPKVEYRRLYAPAWSRSYTGSGAHYDHYRNKEDVLVQGTVPSSGTGNTKSHWGYLNSTDGTSLLSDLAGVPDADIISIRQWFEVPWTYGSGGGSITLSHHGLGSDPGTAPYAGVGAYIGDHAVHRGYSGWADITGTRAGWRSGAIRSLQADTRGDTAVSRWLKFKPGHLEIVYRK